MKLSQTLVFYPTLAWNFLLGRVLKIRNWWDEIDKEVVLGALPFKRDVARLAELGITGVVNTCEEYPGPLEEYKKFGIEQFYMPTVDFTHPRLEDVVGAVEFMDRQISQNGRVYVHCKAGRARSATVVMCWMVKNLQIPAEEIQKKLLKHRPHVNRHLFERPVVREFQKRYFGKRL